MVSPRLLHPVPISTLLRTKDYTFIIEDSDCSVAIYSPEYADEFENAFIATKTSPEFHICTEGEKGSLVSFMASSSGDLVAHPSTAAWGRTSGHGRWRTFASPHQKY